MGTKMNEELKQKVLSRSLRVKTGCLEWQGATNKKGYGRIKFKGKIYSPHRAVVYKQLKGTDLVVCHKCDNPKCVDLNHLFLGTQSDNMLDCSQKGRLYLNKRSGYSLVPIQHGTLKAYNHRGCRCDSCKKAKHEYMKSYYARINS